MRASASQAHFPADTRPSWAKLREVLFTWERNEAKSLQLRVLRLGLLQDGYVGIGSSRA